MYARLLSLYVPDIKLLGINNDIFLVTCHANAPASNRRQVTQCNGREACAHARDDNGKIRTVEYEYEQPMEQVHRLVLVWKIYNMCMR